jgi:hypothetical protein
LTNSSNPLNPTKSTLTTSDLSLPKMIQHYDKPIN